MSIYHLCFSPAGSTYQVGNRIASILSEKHQTIDLTENKLQLENLPIQEEDICVISIPVYGGRVPALVVQKLYQLQGNQARVVLIAVYGNRAFEDALVELADICQSIHLRCIAAISAVAKHSIMNQVASERPDERDKKELDAFALAIRKKIEDNDCSLPVLLGNRPYREYHFIPMDIEVNECRECGLCASKCPAKAISQNAPYQTDKSLCINCMRCVSLCPSHARKLKDEQLSAVVNKLKEACSARKENQIYI